MTYQTINRIVIIGNGCSGKSFLSKQLARALNLPCYHLDDFYWSKNGKSVSSSEWKQTHDQLLTQERWIIEGTQQKLIRDRLINAERIIFLDPPFYVIILRLMKKHMRLGMLDNFPVKKGFITNLGWLTKFYFKIKDKLLAQLPTEKSLILRSKKDIEKFIRTLN